MPLYEFMCKKCNTKVEELCRYDEVVRCEKCREEMKRCVSQNSFQLKGDGWYKDHYGLKKK